MKFLSRLDLSSTNISFFYKGKKSISSSFGGVLSMISMILLILLVLGFGRDFYLRINPYVFFSKLDTGEYQNATLSKSNFTLAFRLEDSNAIRVDPDGLSFYFRVIYENYFRNHTTGQLELTNQQVLPYRDCTIDDVFFEDFGKKDFAYFFCIDFDEIELGGFWDTYFLSLLYINYYKCNQDNPYTSRNCSSEEVTNTLLQGPTYISFLLPDSYYNHSNYISPLTNKVRNEYYILDDKLQKDSYFKLSINQIESNYGWMLDDIQTVSSIDYFSHTIDYSINSQDQQGEMYLGSANFYLMRELQINHRAYTKIQDLIANIGGVFKAVTVFVVFISDMYNQSQLEINLLSNIIGMNESILKKTTCASKDNSKTIDSNRNNHFLKGNKFIFIKSARKDNASLELKSSKSIIDKELLSKKHSSSLSIIASNKVWKYLIFSSCFVFSNYKSLNTLKAKLIEKLCVHKYLGLNEYESNSNFKSSLKVNEGVSI